MARMQSDPTYIGLTICCTQLLYVFGWPILYSLFLDFMLKLENCLFNISILHIFATWSVIFGNCFVP